MEINLLPWRDELIALNRKLFIKLIMIAIISGGITLLLISRIFYADLSYNKSYIDTLERSKTTLLTKINSYLKDKKIQEEIAKRLIILQQLQTSRYDTIRLLNEIAKITPRGIYLSTLSRTNDAVHITGTANSNLLIAQLLQSIDHSKVLRVMSLQKVEKTTSTELTVTEFDLNAQLITSEKVQPQDQKKQTEIFSDPITRLRNAQDEQAKKIDAVSQGKQ